MESDHVCLKWTNHQHSLNMLSAFEHLLDNESLCDVTLACDGLSLKAHKLILSASSSFFEKLFVQNPCTHPIVILTDIKFIDMKALVDFMYRGEVRISQSRLKTIFKAARTLKIKGLTYNIESSSELDGSNSHFPTETVSERDVESFSNESSNSNVSNAKNNEAFPLGNSSEQIDLQYAVNTFSVKEEHFEMDVEQYSTEETPYTAESDATCSSLDVENSNPLTDEKNLVIVDIQGHSDTHIAMIPSKLLEQSMTTENEFPDDSSLASQSELTIDNDTPKRGRKPGSRLCVLCKHVFHSESELETHMANHENNSEVIEVNDIGLESIESPEAHLVNDKTLLKIPLPCSKCNYVMKSLSDAQSHLSMFPGCRSSQFNCLFCPKSFIWPATLIKHFREQHQGPGGTTRVTQRQWYYCDVCKKPLLSKHALSLHRSKFHGLPRSGVSTDGSPESPADSKRGRKQGTRVCRICKRTFISNIDFHEHLELYHKRSVLTNEDDSAFHVNESLSSTENESNM